MAVRGAGRQHETAVSFQYEPLALGHVPSGPLRQALEQQDRNIRALFLFIKGLVKTERGIPRIEARIVPRLLEADPRIVTTHGIKRELASWGTQFFIKQDHGESTNWVEIVPASGGPVPGSRQVIAGGILTGGGTLAADVTITLAEANIDHNNIANVGTNDHAAIDTHIADGTIHFTAASIGSQLVYVGADASPPTGGEPVWLVTDGGAFGGGSVRVSFDGGSTYKETGIVIA